MGLLKTENMLTEYHNFPCYFVTSGFAGFALSLAIVLILFSKVTWPFPSLKKHRKCLG